MVMARRFGPKMKFKKGLHYNVMLLWFAFASVSCVADGASRQNVFQPSSNGRGPDHNTIRTVLEVASIKGLDGEFKALNETEAAQSKYCSRTCESEFCTVAPLLRYGKYCGLLYSGCPGEKPCDDLDNCCMLHDACVQNHHNDYLSTQCSQDLLKCVAHVRNSNWKTFPRSKCKAEEVVDLITVVMEAALVAGTYLHKQ